MTNRQRTLAVLNFNPCDRLPIVHFGFWRETLEKWAAQGHISAEEATGWADGNPIDARIGSKLGFDCNYYSCFHPRTAMMPAFAPKVIRDFPDGSQHRLNSEGVVVLVNKAAQGIPSEIEHLFKGRKAWDELFKHRFQFSPGRVTEAQVRVDDRMVRFDQGGLDFLRADTRQYHYGLYGGSLIGHIRNFIGVENLAYLHLDDEPLFDEIIQTCAEVCYQCTKAVLESGARFDFAHFWEDICYNAGPLVAPAVFAEKIGPHYKRITDLVRSHGIEIISVDCDGCIDALLPIWLENGVNTMFPIEVGTWNASIAPWRAKYGRDLRGVGGMKKYAFALDRAAVDSEIERLRPLVDLGGYLPCPDHRLAPDAKWDLVRYYCDRMHAIHA